MSQIDHAAPIVIDPMVSDLAGETDKIRAAGTLARIELLGVPAWIVTRTAAARQLLADPRLVKDLSAWSLWTAGVVTRNWPLINMIDIGRSMFTVDGPEHRRLRAKVNQALSSRRLIEIRPIIERFTAELLDDLIATWHQGVPVDLKTVFAYPLMMRVVSDLMGVDHADRAMLFEAHQAFFSLLTPDEQRQTILTDLNQYYLRLIRAKTAARTDDLTSDLIFATDGGEQLTEEEVLGNLRALVAAGHENSVGLILNVVRALLTHPDQLALLRSSDYQWSAAVEETLRWDPPVTHVLLRFTTADIEVDGAVIHKGEGVAISYRVIGRDLQLHGDTTDNYDLTRATTNRHLTLFGHGPHICPGAALARLEATIAVPALFSRFPNLRLAVPTTEIQNLPVMTQNDLAGLPLFLE